jgi:hypothetical protein
MTESDMAQDDRITLSVQTPLCEDDDERCQLEHPWYYEGMKFAMYHSGWDPKAAFLGDPTADGDISLCSSGMVDALGSWRVDKNTARRGVICEADSLEAIRGATPVIYNLE